MLAPASERLRNRRAWSHPSIKSCRPPIAFSVCFTSLRLICVAVVRISKVAGHNLVVMLPVPQNDTLIWDNNMCRSKPIRYHSRRGVQRIASLLLPLLVTGLSLSTCSTEPADLQAELYPEDQQPYFKTCPAHDDGTYHERKLQQHLFIDICEEPAPDQGPVVEEWFVRE